MMKMKTTTRGILIFIRTIGNHTMRKSPKTILIQKWCCTNMKVLIMILKMTRQKKIIFIHRK